MADVVASRELRNHTADVLRRVQAGARLTVTVNGRAVAQISPVRGSRRASIPAHELVGLLEHAQADPGLSADLARLAEESTDAQGPIE